MASDGMVVIKVGDSYRGMSRYRATLGGLTIQIVADSDASAPGRARRMFAHGEAVLRRDYPGVIIACEASPGSKVSR